MRLHVQSPWRLAAILAFLAWVCVSAAAGTAGTETSASWATYATLASNTVQANGKLQLNANIQLANEQLQQYGASFDKLSVQMSLETATRLHVKIQPQGQQRWEVPESIVPRGHRAANLNPAACLYAVDEPASGEPFALTVKRRSTGVPIFNTAGHRFMFKDQYIELTTTLPADADLYGLGEVSLPTGLLLPRDGTVLTLWARDMASALAHTNLYGAHPFYLQVNKDGSSHGVLFLNSNGMDIILNPTSLTYKVIGGIIDLYYFMGPSPEAVIRQYHEVIGAPVMPPYWALGLHQSRWGYANMSVLEQVVANYSAAGLPLETVWSDIEYMPHRFWTMEFDSIRYPADAMRALVDKLHSNGQHWVPIQDAGIAADAGYRAYEEGSKKGVWITDHQGEPYLGQVWPGKTVFPDYLSNPKTSSWLKRQLTNMHQQVPFDGLWLDMNEAASFCEGMNCQPDNSNKTALYWLKVATPTDYNISELIPYRTTCQMKCEAAPADNTLANPPYKIHNFDQTGRTDRRNASLSWKTISTTALHANGASQYNTHNLYGTTMALEHYEAVKAVTGKRPFLLTRSTAPGAGRFTAHWTGDNGANWMNIYFSIAGIINTNFWGMSMAGADICGFNDQDFPDGSQKLAEAEYQELCNRWASVGAFYPFSRNHYAYNTRSHEFYRWPDVAAAAKKAYGLRYQLLTYLYGAFFIAYSKGGTVARPLLFTDPSDLLARNATKQWMMGEALLVSPVLEPQTTSIQAHFTAGSWYSAWDYSRIDVPQAQAVQLDIPMGDIAVHYRGGAVVPMQQYASVTRDIRLSPVTLIVTVPSQPASSSAAAPRSKGPLPPYSQEATCTAAVARNEDQLVSCGLLYMDSGDNIKVSEANSVQVWYTAATAADSLSGTLTSTVKANNGDAASKLRIAAVHVLGVSKSATGPPSAQIGGRQLSADLDAEAGVLKISGVNLLAGEHMDITWSL